jgi:hypothetical protein
VNWYTTNWYVYKRGHYNFVIRESEGSGRQGKVLYKTKAMDMDWTNAPHSMGTTIIRVVLRVNSRTSTS